MQFHHKVLFIASEMYPFSKTGGLGDVMARPATVGGWPHYLSLTLPPLAAVALTPEG